MNAEAYELVRQHLGKTAEVCKARCDINVWLVMFEVGSKVWLYCSERLPGTGAKWTRCYRGPYTVVRRVSDVNYVVQLSRVPVYRLFTSTSLRNVASLSQLHVIDA